MLSEFPTKQARNNAVTFVTLKRFAVLFFLPSCCVNSLLTKVGLRLRRWLQFCWKKTKQQQQNNNNNNNNTKQYYSYYGSKITVEDICNKTFAPSYRRNTIIRTHPNAASAMLMNLVCLILMAF